MQNRLITYREAINEALIQEMERDERVFVFGLDVPDHKRIFGSTAGLVEKFGKKRCFGTPLSEDAMTGVALGAAINGLRPVHIHIRADFSLLAMNQLVNMVSVMKYLTKQSVPLVVRIVIGRGWGQGAQHSKSLFSLFAHIPGLKTIAPSTAYDAKGMLISAIRDDNPVIMLEHRWLYDVVDEVPKEPYTVPLGEPKVLREGSDATVVATSWMNMEALKAAEVLEKEKVSLEVIDVRSLSPLNYEKIYESVRKTGSCIVADYDWMYSGFSAEVAARVQENCFNDLDSPVSRIGFAHTPCPTTRPLEDEFYPNAIKIIREVENKVSKSPMDLSGEQFYSYENKFRGPF